GLRCRQWASPYSQVIRPFLEKSCHPSDAPTYPALDLEKPQSLNRHSAVISFQAVKEEATHDPDIFLPEGSPLLGNLIYDRLISEIADLWFRGRIDVFPPLSLEPKKREPSSCRSSEKSARLLTSSSQGAGHAGAYHIGGRRRACRGRRPADPRTRQGADEPGSAAGPGRSRGRQGRCQYRPWSDARQHIRERCQGPRTLRQCSEAA